jgi:hypothetical protein
MINSTAKKSPWAKQQRRVLDRISRMREEMEDLNDYLDLLEARALNKGKQRFTTEEVRRQLGLA